MSDTPRTDECRARWSLGCDIPVWVWDDMAQLERELTAAKEELAATKYVAGNLGQEVARKLNEANAELALLRKRVEAADKIAEAVDKMNEGDWDVEKAVEAYRATEGKKSN